MILESFSIAVISLCSYLLYRMLDRPEPLTFSRRREGADTIITVHARTSLDRIRLEDSAPQAPMFERRSIKRGESVEFRYPYSASPSRLLVRCQGGLDLSFEL